MWSRAQGSAYAAGREVGFRPVADIARRLLSGETVTMELHIKHSGSGRAAPPVWMYATGLIATPVVLLMALSFVVSIGAFAQAGLPVEPEARRIMIGLLFGAPVLAIFLSVCALYPLFVRYHFSPGGLRRSVLGRASQFAWKDVEEIERHPVLGLRVRIRSGPTYLLYEPFTEMPRLVEAAQSAGVRVS